MSWHPLEVQVDMLRSLKELRVQRELVQKHLDWLDAQIEEFEDLNRTRKSTTESYPHCRPLNQEKANASDFIASDTGAIAGEENSTKLFSETSDVKRARIGCIAFFIIITTLFLFLLFVLPYII